MNLTYNDCINLSMALEDNIMRTNWLMEISTENKKYWEKRIQELTKLNEKINTIAIELCPT